MPTLTWAELRLRSRLIRTWNSEMKNYDYAVNLRKEIIKYLFKTIWFLLVLLYFIVFVGESYGQEAVSSEFSEMNEHGLESRTATREPDFFVSGTPFQWTGFYFGVGFRKVGLKVANDVIISDSDGEANGIGVNLGYFWEEQVVEFERQNSIIEHTNSLNYEGKSGQRLEVIQNNFWYSQYPKISRNFYLHYGIGVQFTKTRFAATGSDESYVNEIALGVETGASYFVSSNLLLYYRFSLGQHVPFLTTSGSSPFLKQSQLHTIYLNSYFPL